MSVRISWNAVEEIMGEAAVQAAVEAALAHGGRSGTDLDVVFVDDAFLAGLHERFLDDPSPTDVIAFDLGEDDGSDASGPEANGPGDKGPAGEVYVSVECARRVAPEHGHAVEHELALYLVHGTLHLCGYDDREDAARLEMRRAEHAVLVGLGYPHQPV